MVSWLRCSERLGTRAWEKGRGGGVFPSDGGKIVRQSSGWTAVWLFLFGFENHFIRGRRRWPASKSKVENPSFLSITDASEFLQPIDNYWVISAGCLLRSANCQRTKPVLPKTPATQMGSQLSPLDVFIIICIMTFIDGYSGVFHFPPALRHLSRGGPVVSLASLSFNSTLKQFER